MKTGSPKNISYAGNEQIKPIHWYNLLNWAKQTAVFDKKYYYAQARPLSTSRLWHLAFPNLSRPIFIVGSPRSGTTFLGSCIAQIPEISYHFEPVITKAAARPIYNNEWSFGKASYLYRIVYAWLMRLHADGDLRFAEKTPRNCFLIDFLCKAFPDAQFIHIIRDGRDAALSHSKKPWLQAASANLSKREPGGYRYGPYARFWVEEERIPEFESTTDIHRCIWAWRRHVESILSSASNLPPNQYYELRYEDLVANPKEKAEVLLNFLNISSSSSCQQFYTQVSTARLDSVGAWKKELTSEQLNQIDDEAGKLLKKLNYC